MTLSRRQFLAVCGALACAASAYGQSPTAPDTVLVRSDSLVLHALLWRPRGSGPFPAVLFNHGSYSATDTLAASQVAALGHTFVKHGYVFLLLFRRGVGLSRDQGLPEGTLMKQALTARGQGGRNDVQLRLLRTDALSQALAGLALLRGQPGVDPDRIAVVGHSFGGSLTLLVAAHDTTLRAAIVFSGSARSWPQSPELRRDLLDAAARVATPTMFLQAANDYSTAPGTALAAEMRRLGKPSRVRTYPAVGHTAADGHNFVFRSPEIWEADVFAFLDAHLQH